jgi:UbiD family decarboxylase
MAFDDLRDWIDHLRRNGELCEVTAEVDPYLEIAEITDRVTKAGGPALLFRNVRGSRMPLLINQFGTERRMCMAFGVDSLDELGQRVTDVLEMQPPEGLVDKVRALQKLKSLADSRPKTVSRGACQEIVLDPPSLESLPVMTCWPGDGGPYITLPAVITKDPRSGTRNVGMYRVQVFDATTTAMHWQIHKDAAADWRGMGERMDVAIVLGLDPVTAYTASAPLPKHIDELMLAGFLRGRPVELVRCKTVDLEVPASAEIVIEGHIVKGELRDEGPFGDHTGYYTPREPFPVVHVTAVTMRRDAIYPSIIVGIPPQEDAWLGKATERLFLPALRAGRLRPADRRRLPQPVHRLDPQGVSRPRAQGDARRVGDGAHVADQGRRGGGRRRGRARLQPGHVAGGRERRPQARRAPVGGPARPPRPRPDAPVQRRQDRYRRHRQGPRRGLHAGVAGADPDDRRGARPRHRPLGRVRHRRRCCGDGIHPCHAGENAPFRTFWPGPHMTDTICRVRRYNRRPDDL